MRIILALIILASLFIAFGTSLGAAIMWNYFPSQGINALYFQYNNLLTAFHIIIGLITLCCWPHYKNRKLMIGIIAVFLGSLIINFASKKIEIEKETTVTLDYATYRVSSFELPTLGQRKYNPFAPSPFRLPDRIKNGEEQITSLHFAPKQQFDFNSIFGNETSELFFVAIYSSNAEELDEITEQENSTFAERQNYTLHFYPENAFELEENAKKFKAFIQNNLATLEQNIADRTVTAPNTP